MDTQVAHNIQDKQRTEDVKINENIDFSAMLLSDNILSGLQKCGFQKPSPIQLKAIPLGRCGFDLIIKAKSGTGKTAVFGITALEMVNVKKNNVQVLILAPTREIAVQIKDVLTSIGQDLKGLHVEYFIGGMPLKEDEVKLQKCHIAVGAPGRIRHLIEKKLLNVSETRLFILDEADHLLTSNFQQDVNKIFNSLKNRKQVIAASATYPEELDKFLASYMTSPTHVCPDSKVPMLLGLKQFYVTVKSHLNVIQQMKFKTQKLIEILSNISFNQCLVFSNYQTRAESLSNNLIQAGWPTEFISGHQEQKDRLKALDNLKSFKCRILSSTDLTARGIDASNVDVVINYDIPINTETYLHRIGRAGRYGAYGISITLIAEGKDLENFKTIISNIGQNFSISKLPETNLQELWNCDTSTLPQLFASSQDNDNNNDEIQTTNDNEAEIIIENNNQEDMMNATNNSLEDQKDTIENKENLKNNNENVCNDDLNPGLSDLRSKNVEDFTACQTAEVNKNLAVPKNTKSNKQTDAEISESWNEDNRQEVLQQQHISKQNKENCAKIGKEESQEIKEIINSPNNDPKLSQNTHENINDEFLNKAIIQLNSLLSNPNIQNSDFTNSLSVVLDNIKINNQLEKDTFLNSYKNDDTRSIIRDIANGKFVKKQKLTESEVEHVPNNQNYENEAKNYQENIIFKKNLAMYVITQALSNPNGTINTEYMKNVSNLLEIIKLQDELDKRVITSEKLKEFLLKFNFPSKDSSHDEQSTDLDIETLEDLPSDQTRSRKNKFCNCQENLFTLAHDYAVYKKDDWKDGLCEEHANKLENPEVEESSKKENEHQSYELEDDLYDEDQMEEDYYEDEDYEEEECTEMEESENIYSLACDKTMESSSEYNNKKFINFMDNKHSKMGQRSHFGTKGKNLETKTSKVLNETSVSKNSFETIKSHYYSTSSKTGQAGVPQTKLTGGSRSVVNQPSLPQHINSQSGFQPASFMPVSHEYISPEIQNFVTRRNAYSSYFEHYSGVLRETAPRFTDLRSFYSWFGKWKEEVAAVRDFVQQDIYVKECNK